jgi:hypothetical protein
MDSPSAHRIANTMPGNKRSGSALARWAVITMRFATSKRPLSAFQARAALLIGVVLTAAWIGVLALLYLWV